eukprot:TRINITY_DN23740_c0_g1_i1.p1 TRINITY_DN23740_c0_g1~~TRINITY_DN23740_c0_g1_i1.p1  ORF type:complete len:884 (+),score=185.77 TRINITY_DN23740_c0_g1_i1:77-2728(+)
MPWFSEALQDFGRRGVGLKARVGDKVREIAARTHNFEGTTTSVDLETRLETEARKLHQSIGAAADTIQGWLMFLRASPQQRYIDNSATTVPRAVDFIFVGGPSDGPRSDVTFRQAFLRSRALEFTIDISIRSPELRASLREFALASREQWPEEKNPPMAFAHAFVQLLNSCIGPAEVWLSTLGALLSTEEGPVDEQCHRWLVRLLVGSRDGWEDASVQERERGVEVLEEAARLSLQRGRANEQKSPTNDLHSMLANVSVRGRACGTAYRALSLRCALAADLAQAAERRDLSVQASRGEAAEIAASALTRADALDAQATKQSTSTEEIRGELRDRSGELKNQLGILTPAISQLQRDIEETETTHRMLIQQIGQLVEKLEALKRQKDEAESRAEALRSDLRQVEGIFITKVSTDDEEHRRTQLARSMASAVAELAKGLAVGTIGISGAETSSAAIASADAVADDTRGIPPGGYHDVKARALAADSARSKAIAYATAVALAEQEVERLTELSKTANHCAEVGEEREASRKAMEQLGVPTTTLESDLVGQAEIEHAVQDALTEIERNQSEVESLKQQLIRSAECHGTDAFCDPLASVLSPQDPSAAARLRELAEALGKALASCLDQRERLTALLPKPEVVSPVSGGGADAEPSDDGLDPFLLCEPSSEPAKTSTRGGGRRSLKVRATPPPSPRKPVGAVGVDEPSGFGSTRLGGLFGGFASIARGGGSAASAGEGYPAGGTRRGGHKAVVQEGGPTVAVTAEEETKIPALPESVASDVSSAGAAPLATSAAAANAATVVADASRCQSADESPVVPVGSTSDASPTSTAASFEIVAEASVPSVEATPAATLASSLEVVAATAAAPPAAMPSSAEPAPNSEKDQTGTTG